MPTANLSSSPVNRSTVTVSEEEALERSVGQAEMRHLVQRLLLLNDTVTFWMMRLSGWLVLFLLRLSYD